MAVFPFNADLPKNQWTEIQADGFPASCARLRLRRAPARWRAAARRVGHRLLHTWKGLAMIGHCSIFNDIVPPRADFSEWLTVKIAGGESLPLVHGCHRLLGALSRRRYGLPL